MTRAPGALALVALAAGSSASTSLPFRRMAMSTSMRSSNAVAALPLRRAASHGVATQAQNSVQLSSAPRVWRHVSWLTRSRTLPGDC